MITKPRLLAFFASPIGPGTAKPARLLALAD